MTPAPDHVQRPVGIAAGHLLSARLVEACDEAGLNARLYPDSAEMKWSKLLTNLLGNASSAILDMTPAQVFADPGLYNMEVQQLREAQAVMRALGIQVDERLPAWSGRMTPHVLRHYCASSLYAAGMDIKALQELLGHQWLATTSGYLHVRSDHIERAWNSASDRIEARLGLRTD